MSEWAGIGITRIKRVPVRVRVSKIAVPALAAPAIPILVWNIVEYQCRCSFLSLLSAYRYPPSSFPRSCFSRFDRKLRKLFKTGYGYRSSTDRYCYLRSCREKYPAVKMSTQKMPNPNPNPNPIGYNLNCMVNVQRWTFLLLGIFSARYFYRWTYFHWHFLLLDIFTARRRGISMNIFTAEYLHRHFLPLEIFLLDIFTAGQFFHRINRPIAPIGLYNVVVPVRLLGLRHNFV